MDMARILIVEDELLITEDLKHKLGRLGHVVAAHSVTGEDAVQKITETRPDIVLMDVRLRGEMNGLEAAKRIREIHPVPVVYVTAHANTVAKTINDGDNQFFLTKPFTIGQLEAVIAAASGA
jgi:two-component system, cell cycle sensor histidine kinase and response regulator CckA